MADILKLLLEITLFSSAMILVVLSIKAICGKRIGVRLISVLWILVLVRLILPVTFESPIHLINTTQETKSEATTETDAENIYQSQNDELTQDLYDNGEAVYSENATVPIQSESVGAAAEAVSYSTVFQQVWAYLKMVSAWTYASVVWMLGALILLVKYLVQMVRFSSKVRKCRKTDNAYLNSLLIQNKAAAGVTKPVCIAECGLVDMPVMFGMIKPKILIPKGYTRTIDRRQLGLMIMHELCHIKRQDIFKNYLWLAAKIIHWFNPLVLFAFKAYLDDIELACDEMVLQHVSEDNKFEYSQGLLEAIKLSRKEVKTPAALSFCKDKTKLRERVETIIRPQKKSKTAAATAILLSVVMVLTCFTTACQPTPEEPVVVAKGEFEDIIAQEQVDESPIDTAVETIYESYEVPQNWVESLDMKGSEVEANIDAIVSVPDVGAFPVYEVIQSNFTQQQADRLLDYFVQGKDIIKPPEKTKADYQEMLIEAKRGQMIDGEYVVNESSLAWVEEVEEKIRNAPETSEPQIVTNRSIDGDGFGGVVDLGNGQYGGVSASQRVFNYTNGGYPAPESQYIQQHGKEIEGEITISEDEAVEAAMMVLDDLEINDMVPVSIEKAVFFPRNSLEWDPMAEDPESKGFYIKFALNIDGIDTVLFEGGSYNNEDTYEYCAPWIPECVHIYVDESGNVQYFDWRGPLKLTEKVTENVTLKAFDDIQDKIRDQMFYKCGFYEENEEDVTVAVERIEMKMTIVGVKNDSDKAMYVPAWYIHYVVTRHGNYTDESGKSVTELPSEELLVLNAIDGGVVIPFRVLTDLSNAEDVAAAEDAIDEEMNGE